VQSIAVDTGPLIAWIDASDRHASRAERWLKERGPRFQRYTTLACVTEATHLLEATEQQLALLELLARGAVKIVSVEGPDLPRIAVHVRRYRNVRIDFADATVLWLADRLGTANVLTVDERGFSAYRLPNGRKPVLELQRLG